MEGGPSTPLSVPVASERATRPFEIVSLNPFPKLCSVNLEMPEQGTSWDDFIVIGELRFARAPDVVDNQPVTVGVRRAVLLPVCTNCYVKPGSLHRPSRPGAVDSDGAAQAVFRVNEDDSTAVLEGDQLKGEMLVRFVAAGEPVAGSPEVSIILQLA